MNIKEVSSETGLSKDMIRFYEKKGIVKPSRNSHNNYRDYSIHDMHLLILAKQYNSLGVDLKTIAKIIHTKKIDEISDQLEEQLITLKQNAEWAEAKYQNALDLSILLNKIKQGIYYDTGFRKTLYFYYAKEEDDLNTYTALYLNNGLGRAVYRVEQKYLKRKTYPADTGLLVSKPHLGLNDGFLEIPPHYFYRAVLEINQNSLVSTSEIRNLIKEMHKHGYKENGDIFIYQIMGHIHHTNKETVCVEFSVEKENR